MPKRKRLIEWSDQQLLDADIDKPRLARLVRRLRECSDELMAMGLEVFCESGEGYIITPKIRPTHDEKTERADLGCIIARVGMGFNGGGW